MDPTLQPTPGMSDKAESFEEQIGKLVQSIVNDSALSMEEKRKKVLATLKLLDDGSEAPPAPGPKKEGEEGEEEKAMESLRRSADPAVKLLLGRLDTHQVREKTDKKRAEVVKQCREAKLPDHGMTDVFVEALMAAPEHARKSLIEDRMKVLSPTKPSPTKQPVSNGQGAVDVTVEQFVNFVNQI